MHKLLFSAITVTQLGYHYRVIARAFRPVAISWYNLQKCCAMGKVVPGDCHVAALLAMTVVGATWCHSYHIASKQKFTIGRVSAVWGTHTHVPTADAQVLPKGTGYVTDLGMTGPKISVLGIKPELSIAKFRGDLTGRYQVAPGPTKLEAVVFTIDPTTGKCLKAERADLYD